MVPFFNKAPEWFANIPKAVHLKKSGYIGELVNNLKKGISYCYQLTAGIIGVQKAAPNSSVLYVIKKLC